MKTQPPKIRPVPIAMPSKERVPSRLMGKQLSRAQLHPEEVQVFYVPHGCIAFPPGINVNRPNTLATWKRELNRLAAIV